MTPAVFRGYPWGKTPLIVAMTALVALAAVACSSSGDEKNGGAQAAESKTLKVVTTVSPLTSIAENIGGTRIRLEGIIPEGINSHTFSPAPSVARVMSDADLIILNGLVLEEPARQMAEANKKSGAVILLLGESTISREEWAFDFSFPESGGKPNPHLWPDPIHALKYAELVHEQLVRLDPANDAYYDENMNEFRQRIEALDEGIRAAVQTVPPGNRKLLTYHDSWAYFARRYGMEVIGAVQPANFSQPSAKEVAELIDQVGELQLPAVFGSDVFTSDVLETIARESGATFIDQLRDDDLPGAPGEPRHSYLGLMLENMEIMIPALGGNVSSLAGFDPSPVFEGRSTAKYPQ